MKQKLLMGLLILYIISPVDAMPGPIDDIIVLLIGFAARKQIFPTKTKVQ